MLDTLTRLFVIPPSDKPPSWSHVRGLVAIAVGVGACGLFIMLIPATPMGFAGGQFSVLGRVGTYVGLAVGFAGCLALNRRPRRADRRRRAGVSPWMFVFLMLYQPARAAGPEALALYAGTTASAVTWFVAYMLTLAAIDARELRCLEAEAPTASVAGGRSLSEEIDFWDRE